MTAGHRHQHVSRSPAGLPIVVSTVIAVIAFALALTIPQIWLGLKAFAAMAAGTAPAVPAVPAAAAATAPTLDVDILPEHDDPRVLVIYRGTLPEGAPPYQVTFSIPGASQVHALAYRRGDQLFSTVYDARPEGNRLQVTFALPEREFQFEYYMEFTARRPERRFSIALTFPFAVDLLRIAVEQPARASNFRVFPEGEKLTSGGFTYYLLTQSRVGAGQPVTVRAVYAKPDDEPSLPRSSAPVAAPPAAAPAPSALSPYIWIAIIVAGVVIAAAILAAPFLRRDRDRSSRRPAPPPPPRKRRQPQGQQEGQPRRYCENCGARARPEDRFCSQCGRPLP